MDLEHLIETLVQELKLGALPEKDKNDTFQLNINGTTQVALKSFQHGIHFSAQISPLPKEENKEALFIYLMKANLLGKGTGGGALGIDPSGTYLTLSLTLVKDPSYTHFHERLEDFINYVDYWKEEIPKFQQKLM